MANEPALFPEKLPEQGSFSAPDTAQRRIVVTIERNDQTFRPEGPLVAFSKDMAALVLDMALTPLSVPYSFYKRAREEHHDPVVSAALAGFVVFPAVVGSVTTALSCGAVPILLNLPHTTFGLVAKLTLGVLLASTYALSCSYGMVGIPEISYSRTIQRNALRKERKGQAGSTRPENRASFLPVAGFEAR